MNELLDLELDEVSLVDSPANKSATVALFKRDTTMEEEIAEITTDLVGTEKSVCIEIEIKSPEEDMVDEMIDAQEEAMAAPAADTQVTPPSLISMQGVEADMLMSELDQLKATNAALMDQINQLTKADVEKADEMIDFGGEMVAKSAIPAPVLKKLEEVNKAYEAESLRKRANEVLPNFKGTADQRGKLLKSVGDDSEILEMLRAADALFASAFAEIGKTDAENDLKTADVKLDEMVKARQVEKGEDFYKSYAAVIKTAEGKSLLLQTYKK